MQRQVGGLPDYEVERWTKNKNLQPFLSKTCGKGEGGVAVPVAVAAELVRNLVPLFFIECSTNMIKQISFNSRKE